MSIIYNGTTIDTIVYNGTTLDKVIYNGTEVYSKSTASYLDIKLAYVDSTAESYWMSSSIENDQKVFNGYIKHSATTEVSTCRINLETSRGLPSGNHTITGSYLIENATYGSLFVDIYFWFNNFEDYKAYYNTGKNSINFSFSTSESNLRIGCGVFGGSSYEEAEATFHIYNLCIDGTPFNYLF